MGSINNEIDDISFHVVNPLDPEEFRSQAHKVVDFIADYYKNIEQFPVVSQVHPSYLRKTIPQQSAPNAPESLESILQDVSRHVVPGITHWQNPNFFAYFPASNSTAGLLGEMLSTGFNVVGFNWLSSPAVTELEMLVVDWFGEMLNLPKSFLFSGGGGGGGVLQGTTCEAILCTLVAARDKKLKEIGREKLSKLVVYGSDQTHMSLQKAAHVAGFSEENFRVIKTTKSESFRLSPNSLKMAIQSDIKKGFVPLYLCATIGTTSTNAVDPLDPLCDIAQQNGIWVHVDAAYAGSACICPEFRHFINGIEKANSFSLNAHKWFFSAPDCCCLWLKDPSTLRNSLSVNPLYLRNKATDLGEVVDYKDWQITLSKRFRAIKLWVVMKSYGVANLRNLLRSHVKMAKLFEELVGRDERFEVVVPRNFGLVCFRLSFNEVDKSNTMNLKLLEGINKSGRVYMTHAIVEDMYVIRFAVGGSMTEERHVIMAWKLVQELVKKVLEG
ncbi:tyrosine decarboxylase-like [Benincasa hispida]|uniref:tyrosine decarboxylase-like n=1 Tax=Benincasa hispida TaxID=102211 RepID=UPI0019003DCC|nr:tyrosine decarboxylase-like [Benincasa hispida]